MRRYTRSQIENFILKGRMTDLSKCSDGYLSEQLKLLLRMKHYLDMSEAEQKAMFTLIKGGKDADNI